MMKLDEAIMLAIQGKLPLIEQLDEDKQKVFNRIAILSRAINNQIVNEKEYYNLGISNMWAIYYKKLDEYKTKPEKWVVYLCLYNGQISKMGYMADINTLGTLYKAYLYNSKQDAEKAKSNFRIPENFKLVSSSIKSLSEIFT